MNQIKKTKKIMDEKGKKRKDVIKQLIKNQDPKKENVIRDGQNKKRYNLNKLRGS